MDIASGDIVNVERTLGLDILHFIVFSPFLPSQDKELRDVGDWRKNIDDKAGMDGRKKMFQGDN